MKRILTLILILYTSTGNAYNLRQISSRDGLSNSSVYCLFQDSRRYLWLGSFDGLNRYDGRYINIYKPDINNCNSLSSNVIRNITETENNYLWISTKWGLNKLALRENIIMEYYNEFKDDSHIARDSRDNLFVMGKTGQMSVYDKERNMFIDLPVNPDIRCENVSRFFIDHNNIIFIVHDGVIEKYSVTENYNILRQPNYEHPHPVEYANYDKGRLLFSDSKGDLWIDNPQRKVFVRNIRTLINDNGDISSIIMDGADIFVGFRTNGLFRLDAQNQYEPEHIGINCGVFSLLKDNNQDIIWIGTDGQGVYTYTKDSYTFTSLNLFQLPVIKQRPVRAVCTDSDDNLWLGTKDNGVIRIINHSSSGHYGVENVRHYTESDGLSNNAVYAFCRSVRNNVMWIASDGPALNYYSYEDNKISSLVNHTALSFSNIHSIFEASDTILWVGTGNTLTKINIRRKGSYLETTGVRRYDFDVKNNQIYNLIYSLVPENDTIIWIGMRGNGIIRFNSTTGNYRLIAFDERNIAPMNDILCIHRDSRNVLWLGSSYGLTRFEMLPDGSYNYKNYNENDGLPNNTIHGILESNDGELWISSNTGIILFDPNKESFRSFNHKTGLKIIEFSDNAWFADTTGNKFYFGGVDGIVEIRSEKSRIKNYIPDILFSKLRIFNKEYNINDFKYDDNQGIKLKYNQNFFAVSFIAMDFVNGENSRYYYKLDNFSDIWMDAPANEALFTNIPPGNYRLRIRYDNGLVNTELSLAVTVLPPWYATVMARIVYALLALGAAFLVYLYLKMKYERKKQDMTRQLDAKYREEVYEGKLRFFTNISHEFCTPLTLIYGPCERLLAREGDNPLIKKYVTIIKNNAERLNNLIEEVIDFRRMETGNKTLNIENVNISALLSDISVSFNELAEHNEVDFEILFEPDICWNTDASCFEKVINNLISNAFKYTPPNGKISVTADKVDNMLIIKVYNTGKGIRQDDIPLLFNRYSVMDNIKENFVKGLSSRNGLGLAICRNAVELLGGVITVESEPDNFARFIVAIPNGRPLELNCFASGSIAQQSNSSNSSNNSNNSNDESKSQIIIIDDNRELLWMMREILSDEYEVFTADDGEKGLQLLMQSEPDIIITDIMMPNLDGITLTRQIKQNPHTMHIPLIILSAKNTTDDKIEGLESGADAYVAKPFEPDFLKAVIKRLMNARKTIHDYYNSSAVAYKFDNGRLLAKEDIAFLTKAAKIITDNIDNSEFATDDLAASLQVSLRNLYRRFKDLKQPSPNDFIKEIRLKHVATMLVTTDLTVQEIMYAAGFNNRSHFNREFFKHYNQTPKQYREAKKQPTDSL
ncbi:MAG: response regulator [Tannerella sp.]|jgi:signal transduction histidine kinase/DNA-binding response OmpR family regulator/ligand-binding sensor domain-containing protein|nr:response regulator [Tannerella sp.]